MPSLRDIRTRIRSVKNTQQITKAMKMVAAAKLRRAQDAIMAARPYAEAINGILNNLASRGEAIEHPLLQPRQVKRIELVVITGDRGLAGGFNSNILRRAQRFLNENKGVEVVLTTVGRKGNDYFRKRSIAVRADKPGMVAKVNYAASRDLASEVTERFLQGHVDAVYVLYNEFVSAISQRVTLTQMLPIQAAAAKPAEATDAKAHQGASLIDYLYEPSREAVLDALLPRSLAVKIYRAMLESNASFQGAQMTAMESATKNAREMIGRLTLVYNRTRQAVITKELMEIVSGAEALK
jgi:F-type H+-transporting ATPase subunit gamma